LGRNEFLSLISCILVDGNTAKGEGMYSSWFCRSGQSNLRYFLVLFV